MAQREQAEDNAEPAPTAVARGKKLRRDHRGEIDQTEQGAEEDELAGLVRREQDHERHGADAVKAAEQRTVIPAIRDRSRGQRAQNVEGG